MRTGTLGIVLVVFATSTASAQHFTDVWVGQSGDGQLAIGGVSLDVPIVLGPVSGVVTGWSGANPGFDNVQNGSPDLRPLAGGAEIVLDLVSISPGFAMIDDNHHKHTHEDIAESASGVDSVYLGDDHLHIHFTWLIDSTSDRFDPMQTLWTVDLRLRDESGIQTTSDTFRIMFRNVECELSGDLNADGWVTDADLDLFYGVLENPELATHEARCASDLDLDGFATAADEVMFLEEVGLPETPVRGDANGNRIVDMSDALMVVKYLFLAASEPVSMVHANANGDQGVDLIDPMYLLNYLFLGGDQPPAPFEL